VSAPLVFMDTETTGLSLDDDIWEFAAIRRDPDGTETELHLFIEHDRKRCAKLPESFREDHYSRYLDHRAVDRAGAGYQIRNLFGTAPKPHVVGAVPNFDTERVARLLIAGGHRPTSDPWHYHLIDVENLAVGYLRGMQLDNGGPTARAERASLQPPWDSDKLATALGVTIDEKDRHTAMGDARWAMRIYDAVMSGPR
jgi:hypothetical protein